MSGRFSACVSVCLGLGLLWAQATSSADPLDKVDPWLQTRMWDKSTMEFILVMNDQLDGSQLRNIRKRDLRLRMTVSRLGEITKRSQRPVVNILEREGVAYRQFWVANAIWVRGPAALIRELAARDDIRSIDSNPQVGLAAPRRAPAATADKAIEWNVDQIGAPDVWALGFTGQGVVIGGQDTGYQWTHLALINSYRGWDGVTVNHAYNWHDAIHTSIGVCGADSPFPCDDADHGSHTMGTMVGDDGGSNQIGVAPGARWIGCRNMNGGVGTPASYMECFQWFLAPTDGNGANPDPTRAPHVINNSWACPPFEGCTDPDALLQTVVNVRAAGIVVVVSAGNGGSLCNSVTSPPALYDESFSVGATDASDGIATFSSRGPVTIDASNRLKPDISAPGVNVRSSVRGGYAAFNGTSMAAPHVAGLVALMISAEPTLAGDVDEIERIIEETALPRTTTTQNCGGTPGSEVPNNTYGFGRIDALAAVTAAMQRVFADGFETQ